MQGRISPSRTAPYVMLFSVGEAGVGSVYSDRWVRHLGEVRYLYVGEGVTGDQPMSHGNRQVLHHGEDGRALWVFYGDRGEVTCAGEFEVDPELPWAVLEGPDRDGVVRRMVAFRLRPLVDVEPEGRVDDLDAGPEPTDMDPGDIAMLTSEIPGRPAGVHRVEGALVKRYRAWANANGGDPRPYRLPPRPGEVTVGFADLYDPTTGTLVEATGTTARHALHAAVGRLTDIRARLEPVATAVLLPGQPDDDDVRLLHDAGHDVIFENDAGEFEHLGADADGEFVVHDQAAREDAS